MKKLLGVTSLVLVLAACGGAGSPTPASSVPSQEAPVATTAPASPAAAASVAPATPEGYLFCPAATTADTCPLPPGEYKADIHDSFTLTIPDAGWQEIRAEGVSFEQALVLSRVDAPDQRLVIQSGPTGLRLDDAAMAAMLDHTTAIQVAAPSAAEIGGAPGFQVDLAPTERGTVLVGGAGGVDVEANHRYRLAALQQLMDQESALKIILIDAPPAGFDSFAPLADAVLHSLKFP